MDASHHFIAPDPERFAVLVQRQSLAGLHFEAMPPLRVRDRYLDTAAGALLAGGRSLRLRFQDGHTKASLRPIGGGDAVTGRFDGEPDALPPGPVLHAARSLVGDAPLEPFAVLRQYRLPRGVYDGRRLVGVLSLDVVTVEGAAEPASWHEAELEPTAQGAPADLRRLGAELAALGLEPTERTKFERAVLLLDRDGDGPLRLLPDERAALERFLASESAVERRRAETLLLAADGLPTRTISHRAELSPSRVRHWKHAFRTDRLAVFLSAEPDDDEPAAEPEPRENGRRFRIADVVAPAPRPSAAEVTDLFELALDLAHRDPGTPRLGAGPER